ncbi:bifunctional DNA primase/polymerase [Streptomyces sp. ICBB 8177]|uniref:bifunctional DNA primase/polymerase n=1 Tax=Streptomyces sp. ICBB 8177 TaxID=563922 RepID=UPI000D67BA12|nr:bifunctional DNA primase/polymerase [Streptomyces sp. ICBB 8177]PWI41133.1 DNA primase [Streptomyces sp. ICBB 8177]
MREILGRRRRWFMGSRRQKGTQPWEAALLCATRWRWPVLPGVGLDRRAEALGARGAERERTAAYPPGEDGTPHAPGDGPPARVCACPHPDCAVPGAHPHDPGLLAATTDARMVEWWWTRRPDAPVLLATGGPVSAVSLPATAGVRALRTLERMGVRLGPVVATPTRCALLVAPYEFEQLGELLARHEWVPSSLRYHGRGGYLVLPPSRIASGGVGWERAPQPGPGGSAPWLPRIEVIVDSLVAAGTREPDENRLAY